MARATNPGGKLGGQPLLLPQEQLVISPWTTEPIQPSGNFYQQRASGHKHKNKLVQL